MTFSDATLLRLGDPASRASVLDESALGGLIAAGFDVRGLPLEGPMSPVFDAVELGFQVSRPAVIEGSWQGAGGEARQELRLALAGVAETMVRFDAVWDGAVIARVAAGEGRISDARVGWPRVGGIDGQIVAELGALPSGALALEAVRRERLVRAVGDHLSQPEAVAERAVGALLEESGAGGVGEYLEQAAGGSRPGAVQVTFEEGPAAAPAPAVFPVRVGVLIRDAAQFSLSGLLWDSRAGMSALQSVQGARVVPAGVRRRRTAVVLWVVPAAVFDDAGWPGATGTGAASRAARRSAASIWLAEQGIALMALAE